MATRIDADPLVPDRGEPIRRGAVVLEGTRIVHAGPAPGAPAGDGPVTEAATVLPGLWECHGHCPGMRTPDLEVLAMEPAAAKAGGAVADMAVTLRGGVTTVRVAAGLGSHVRHVVDEGRIPGPRIHAAGSILATTGGHLDVHGLPLDGVNGPADPERFGVPCDGVPDCLRAVRRQLDKGATVIEICASGGVGGELDDPVHRRSSDDEPDAIVAEASRAGVPVAAHCHGRPGTMAALRVGVATPEHGSHLDEESAERTEQTGAIPVPTRVVVEELAGMEEVLPAHFHRKTVVIADRHADAMRLAVAAVMTVATRTDSFVSRPVYGTDGREIRDLIEAGTTVLQAIEAATAGGPAMLGSRAPRSGRAPGPDADVIFIDGDPLDDLGLQGDPDRVAHVWKGGVPQRSPG